MALPVPNLDDRRFQDLVDDAKRLVQQRCPEWSDHNVHDPGVTLIELFAWMTDQLVYRLNRVPDRNYVKLLELIGVRLFPPTAAKAPVTFWLAAPQPGLVTIPAGTEVATVRTETDEAVVFSTVADLLIVPSELRALATQSGEGEVRERTEDVRGKDGFQAFQPEPVPGDSLLVGLSEAVPSCAVTLRLICQAEGVGVDPDDPPLVWEAWDGSNWTACEVDHDETGGLNTDGDLVLHVPASHAVSVIEQRRGGWLRARVVEAAEGQPPYSASPRILGVTAFTIGGTTEAVHAERIQAEVLGVSEGVPGQRFQISRVPAVPASEREVLEVSEGEGWQEWLPTNDFADHGPQDRVFSFDHASGEVALAPAIRQPDGSLRQFGSVPAKGAQMRLQSYRHGGGARGNVMARTISVLKSSIPYVSGVVNRIAAVGGVDGEDIENAKIRGPIQLRALGRAVTAEDYEILAQEAAPEVARVRCVPAEAGAEAGGVRILVVPAAATDRGRLDFGQLVPSEETLQRIAARLDETRVVGARIMVEPPRYQGLTVVARLRPRDRVEASALQEDALEALYSYFHPIIGGPGGRGWPFGRAVHVGEVYAVLQALPGVEVVEDARLFPADPISGQRGQAGQRIEIESHALVFSYGHQVLVEGA
jgi:predicted phage baseplate assembly protein